MTRVAAVNSFTLVPGRGDMIDSDRVFESDCSGQSVDAEEVFLASVKTWPLPPNLSSKPRRVVKFCNECGTAGQWIREEKQALN